MNTSFFPGLALKIKIILARKSRILFSRYYSVIDNNLEVPIQVAAYQLVLNKYISPENRVLDVGFGLGYGMEIMAKKAKSVSGIEIDHKALNQYRRTNNDFKITDLKIYDGYKIPYPERSFDVITCIDVLEHVPNYQLLVQNMCKTAKSTVVISTPNRRPEYTLDNGKPANIWHLREWNTKELDSILRNIGHNFEWNFINGPWEGPFKISQEETQDTLALVPVILLDQK